jgi:opacity protein-like surface antigen
VCKITFAVIAAAAIAAGSHGVGLGFGGYYLVGMPMGELTASDFSAMGETIPIDMDSGIPFKLGPTNFGGGGAFVMESFSKAESWVGDEPESKNEPGFYLGGGFQYFFTDAFAVDVNPRWMMVLDSEEADEAQGTEATSNSMFIDFLIGVDYYFM